MSRRRSHREKPSVAAATPPTPAVPISKGTSPDSARFDLSFCALGAVLIICAMLLTFRFAMSPDNARFLGIADTWTYYGPTLSFMDHAVHNDHELPLWDPLYFCGQPHAANPQSFVFYPPNLLRSLLTVHPTPLRTHAGIALMVLAQTVIASMGALLLARRHGYTYGAALLAAFAFPFSGALVARAIGHWIFLNGTCWLPWALLCAHAMVHGRALSRRAAAAAGTGLLYGICILGGVPSLTLVGGLLLGAYWLLETLGAAWAAGHAPGRRPWKQAFGTVLSGTVLFAFAMVIAGMLAAPLLLPLAQFAPLTGRAGAAAGVEDFAPLGYGWKLVKTLLFYSGHESYEGIRGGGEAVAAFALLAVLLKPRWNALRWAILFAMVLDLSVSQPLLFGKLVRALAPSISNNPGRSMAVGCLPLALLAGWGLDAVMQTSSDARRRVVATALASVTGGVILAVLVFAAPPGSHAAPRAALVLAALAIAAALAGLWTREHLIAGIVAAMLVLGETLAWNAVLLPDMMKPGMLYPEPLGHLAETRTYPLDNRRTADSQPNTPLYDLRFIMNGYDPLHLLATRNTVSPFVIPPKEYLMRTIQAHEPTALSQHGNLFLKRRFWLAREYCPARLPAPARLFPPADVVFLPDSHDLPVPAVTLDQIPETGLSEQGAKASLLVDGHPLRITREMMQNPDITATIGEASPDGRHSSLFLTFAGEGKMKFVPVFKDLATSEMQFGFQRSAELKAGTPQTFEFPMPEGDRAQVVLRVDFTEPAKDVLVTGADVVADAGDENGRIQITHQAANTAEVRLTNLPRPRVLLYVDSFYPGWKATVNGTDAPILRANDAFKAVVVPAGDSVVRFSFSSSRVMAGLALAAISILLVCGTVAAAWANGRRGARADSPCPGGGPCA